MFLEDKRTGRLTSESMLRKEKERRFLKCSGLYFDVFKAARCERVFKLKTGRFLRKDQDEG